MEVRKRPVRKRKKLREDITLKAGELFGEKGYHGVTVEQIAKALGISKPSIYYHFGSKEEILFEFHMIAHQRSLDCLVSIFESDAGPVEKLRRAIESHIDLLSFEVTPNMSDVHLKFSLPKEFEEPIKELRRKYDRLLKAIIKEGIKQGVFRNVDYSVIGLTITGAINFLPQWYSEKGKLSKEDIKVIMVDYLLSGICK